MVVLTSTRASSKELGKLLEGIDVSKSKIKSFVFKRRSIRCQIWRAVRQNVTCPVVLIMFLNDIVLHGLCGNRYLCKILIKSGLF